MTSPQAEELLADVRTLRLGARRDRRASVFPLLLFGALILAAPLCFVPSDMPLEHWRTGPWRDRGPFPLFYDPDPFRPIEYPRLIGWYWFLTIVGGFTATAWWYRRRGMGVGVETDTKAYLRVCGAAMAGFLLGVPVLKELGPDSSLYSTPGVNLPLLTGAAVASAAVLFWCTRDGRTNLARTAGVLVGVLLATLAFAAVGVYMIHGLAALLVIAAGLLALAWLERNVLLAGVGLVFSGVALTVNLANVENVFATDGVTTLQPQLLALQRLLLPALVLLVGGLVVVVANRRTPR